MKESSYILGAMNVVYRGRRTFLKAGRGRVCGVSELVDVELEMDIMKNLLTNITFKF